MLRKLVVDERRVDYVARRALGRTPIRGILLGRLGCGKSEAVFAAVETPPVDDGVDPAAWALEHAAAVEKMLPGGVDVVGVFRFGEVRADDASALCRMARAVVRAATRRPGDRDYAIVMMTAQDGRVVARSCEVTGTGADLRPLELRVQRDLTKSLAVRTARCKISIHENLVGTISDAERLLRDRLNSAVAVYNGVPVMSATDARLVAEVLPDGKETHDIVDLYIRPQTETAEPRSGKRACINGAFDLVASIDGSLSLRAATECIKQDFVRTLRARLDLMMETAAESCGCAVEDFHAPPGFVADMPVRICSQTEDDLTFVDYLHRDESIDDASERFAEMLGWTATELDTAVITQSEQWPDKPQEKRTSPVASSNDNIDRATQSPSERGSRFPAVVALLVALLAVALALVFRISSAR